MNIEENVFRKRILVPGSLEKAGFKKKDGLWYFSTLFMDGDFRADITVTDEGKVSGRVFDTATGDEYTAIRFSSRSGSFVGTVRQAYTDILEDIAGKCFKEQVFASRQANRIASLISEKYGEKPDFPFSMDAFKECGIFRYPENRKWYAAVMNVKKYLVTGEKPEDTENAPGVDVVNIKVGEETAKEVLAEPGIYPAYHMSHKSWVSILLDETVPDERIMELTGISRDFAVSASSPKRKGKKNWIVPANPSYYDIDAAFEKDDEIIWKQGNGILKGDTAYMYVASPVSAVRYKCEVTETRIPYRYSDDNVSMKYVMKIKKLETYPEDAFPMAKLREYGIKFIRGPVYATDEFVEAVGEYMKKKSASNHK